MWCLWILTKGCFHEEEVQFSHVTFRICYQHSVLSSALNLNGFCQIFDSHQQYHQICEFSPFPALLSWRNCIFHFRSCSVLTWSFLRCSDSLMPALLLHKCFFVYFANSASFLVGWDWAAVALYIACEDVKNWNVISSTVLRHRGLAQG